jgi:hypothetical protein
MQEHKESPRTAASKTTKLLTAVALMQGLILAGQWTGGASTQLAQAQAAPSAADPAAYRQQTLEELKAMNTKLEKLVNLLESGRLQVTVEGAKKADGAKR